MKTKYKNELCYPLLFPEKNIVCVFEGNFAYLNYEESASILSKYGNELYVMECNILKYIQNRRATENEIKKLETDIQTIEVQIQTFELQIDHITGNDSSVHSYYSSESDNNIYDSLHQKIQKKLSTIYSKQQSIETKRKKLQNIDHSIRDEETKINKFIDELNSKMMYFVEKYNLSINSNSFQS